MKFSDRFVPPLALNFLFALALHAAPPACRAADEKPPNILIILADDLGFSDVGCYGSEIETPHLDRLASNGLRYTQFYSTARCWPTRAAMLTGYYAQQVRRDALPGIEKGGHGKRPAWARLLPAMLRDHGYRSYHSGKWHLDGRPLSEGFHRTYRMDDFDRHLGAQQHFLDGKPLPPEARDGGYYSSTAIAQHAIDFLQEHHEQHSDQPFFQYLAFLAPHFPLQAPENDVARYQGNYDKGWDAVRAERWRRSQQMLQLEGTLSDLEHKIGPPYHFPEALSQLGDVEVNREVAWKSLTAEQQEFQATKMEIHAAMVSGLDREVGRVLDQLRTMGELDNTVIFFLADNGGSAEIMVRGDGHDPNAPPGSAHSYLCLGPGWSSAANTPFRRHKVWVHEGGIASPLIVHWPKGVDASGELRHAMGHVIDIAPTVLELAGADWPTTPSARVPHPPGHSLVPSFASDEPTPHDHLWWLHEGNRALRQGGWKTVSDAGGQWELYNLADDRAENHNLADKHPEKVEELANIWETMCDQMQQQLQRADGT